MRTRYTYYPNEGTLLGRNARPSRKLLKFVSRAIGDYGMIRPGDRLLLGLSGGKDSLTLLHVLLELKRRSPVPFELAAMTVDPQSDDFDPFPLKHYVPRFGIPYFIESYPIVEIAKACMTKPSYCSFCSRQRRGSMYGRARREGYNVLVLGQHLDDLAEAYVMSLFYNGSARTMKAHYQIRKGDLRVIRPLAYVRESMTRAFAEDHRLPVIYENCPACFAKPTERERIKKMLAEQEMVQPTLFPNLLHAMEPVLGVKGGLLELPPEVEEEDEGDGEMVENAETAS